MDYGRKGISHHPPPDLGRDRRSIHSKLKGETLKPQLISDVLKISLSGFSTVPNESLSPSVVCVLIMTKDENIYHKLRTNHLNQRLVSRISSMLHPRISSRNQQFVPPHQVSLRRRCPGHLGTENRSPNTHDHDLWLGFSRDVGRHKLKPSRRC